MTTKVRIEFPEKNHAPFIDIYSSNPATKSQSLLKRLEQGQTYEGYVYTGQDLVIVEKFE